MPNDSFTLEGIEYSKEDITKALECLSLNNRTNHKSDNNGEEYSILYKDNRYSIKLIYEQMKINKNLPYKNTLGSTSIRKKISEYYEVLPCIHSNVNINRLKEEFRKYLNEIYPAGYDKTYEYDPFYLINNSKNTDIKDCCKDRNIYFWKIFENDENLQKYYDVLKEKRSSNTYNSYISSTNRLKNFFIKKYGSYIDWIRSLNEINYYVVSQREHYEEAKQKGIIFSSAKVEHRRMRYLKPNDIILSYVDGINAKLTVLEEPSIDEASNYIEVKVKFEELKTPISREEIRYRLGDLYNYLTQEEYPFAKNKNEKICSIKQRGFLFNFTEEAYNLLFSNEKSNFANKNLEDYRKMNNKNLSFTLPKNQILYGPPGTGKTYNTIIKAMDIINPKLVQRDKDGNVEKYNELKTEFDKLKQQGQIEFVTFHQSYSYEEFVEGIKPEIPKWNDEGSELKYVGKDGIFKNICEHAKPIKVSSIKHQPIDFSHTKVFKMSLGNTLEKEDDIYEYCISNDVVALGFKDVDFSDCKTSQDFKDKDDSWGATALERFVNWMDIGDIIIVSNGNRNFRAIAQVTGDYYYDRTTPIRYSHFRKVEWLYKGEDIYYSKINNKVFSQQSIYGYFDPSKKGMSNYNPDLNTQELNNIITGKVDKEIALPHILIIDEINRGNISKIFGELITLIEEDKRGTLSVKLPYSQDDFTVPQNLYIIGTMNTSDRSIASIDIALRRRFKFVEMMPRPELVADFGCGFQSIFENLNTRIKILLDRDHQIGHSYFINTKYANADVNILKEIWFSEIIPLLNEYFYCDWEKLKLVIPGFIKKINIPEELKNDCEDSMYEFKTPNEVKDFVGALTQDKFKQEN